MTDPRAPIFQEVRKAAPNGVFNSTANIKLLDDTLDELGVPRPGSAPDMLVPSRRAIKLLHDFEQCAMSIGRNRFTSYPDPGSRDGKPFTIGWGSTGPGIGPTTVWTQAQCDARFELDLKRFADRARRAIGIAATTQSQFDAMVCFDYNTGRIHNSTLTRKHVAGDYEGAAREFRRWVFNDGNRMTGLVRRRAAEEALYRSELP